MAGMPVVLSVNVRRRAMQAILAARSGEITGFVVRGHQGDELMLVPNIATTRDTFLITDSARRRFYEYALNNDLKIEAFLHSHPVDLGLSVADEKTFCQSRIPWIIVALVESDVRAVIYWPQS
jgi:proteasome lid subunit RPN8/RPN11